MDSNTLTPEQLAAIRVGDAVLVQYWPTTTPDPEYRFERVTRLTPTRIITTSKTHGQDVVGSYPRENGAQPGPRLGYTVALVDPDHPDTVRGLGAHRRSVARLRIERLHDEWQRDPDDLEKARELKARLADYLARYGTGEPTT